MTLLKPNIVRKDAPPIQRANVETTNKFLKQERMPLQKRKCFIKEAFRLAVLWSIGIALNLDCNCLASKSPDDVSRTRKIDLVYSVRANLKSSNETFSPFNDNRNRRKNKTVRTILASKSNHPTDENAFARNLNTAKIKRVCGLLERALDGLKKFGKSTSAGGVSKLKDKSSKTKPSLCFCPCGCGGCLMRPMIMYKIKYTPPRFKMTPLKSKTKCGCPHYGIHLGRKRR